MKEPQPLGAGFAELLRRYPEGRIHDIAKAVVRNTDVCARRRAGVLKYPDLAARLPCDPPRTWNGWIPPQLILPGSDEEILRSAEGRISQRAKRATGEQVNDSPQRALLVEIVNEAWQREHPE